MGQPVVTVAAGGLPVIDVTGTAPRLGLPVTEAGLGRGIAVTKVTANGLPVTYDLAPEASAYLARATGIDATHASVMSTLLNGLKADGTLGIFDLIHFYAHQTSALGLLNLVSSSYNGTLIGAPAFLADRGFLGVDGGAVAVNTQFNPSTAPSPKYTRNAMHMSYWSVNNLQSANAGVGATSAGVFSLMYPRYTDDVAWCRLNNANTGGAAVVADSVGYSIGVRESASIQWQIKNNALVGYDAADASTGVPTNNIYAVGSNQAATTVGWGGRLALLTIGGVFTQAQARSVTSRFRTAMAALGVPVPATLDATALPAPPPIGSGPPDVVLP